jgi:hypothetical protein
MRRGFSIILILVFGLMPLSALVDGSEDANLPACCRRHGVHHCSMNVAAMRAQIERDSTPAFSAPLTCPYYPGAATAFSTPPPALTVAISSGQVLIAQLRVALGFHTAPLSSPNRTHAGRGPPTTDS